MVLNRLLRYGGGNSSAATNLARYTRLSLSSSVTLLDKIAGATSTTQHYRHHRYRYYSSNQGNQYNDKSNNIFMVASAIVAASAGVLSLSHGGSPAVSQCEEATASVDNCSSEDIEELELPTYTMDQVSQNNGKGSNKRIWMTYGGCVYDTTDFIANHPGGSEKILLAAGGPIEPHWHCEFCLCILIVFPCLPVLSSNMYLQTHNDTLYDTYLYGHDSVSAALCN